LINIIFYIAIALLCYTYFFYPIFLLFLATFFKKPVDKKNSTPTVSLIIAAYNEQNFIYQKLINSLALDYDKNRIEIIVASDCSDDKTDEIASSFQDNGIRLVRLPYRGGKTAVQNLAFRQATGEILIFSDTKAIYDERAIRKIVENFNDQAVGCVGGCLLWKGTLQKSKNIIEWFEQKFKTSESEFYSIIGVDGCIYGVRKALFETLPENLTSDLVTPLRILQKGYRTVFEKEALCYVETVANEKSELKRKARTVRAGLFAIFNCRNMLNPLRYLRISFLLISRKVIRWLTPLLLLVCFVTNLILLHQDQIFYLSTLLIQVIFYLCALIGLKSELKIFKLPYRFCLLAIAAMYGWYLFLGSKNQEIWQRK